MLSERKIRLVVCTALAPAALVLLGCTGGSFSAAEQPDAAEPELDAQDTDAPLPDAGDVSVSEAKPDAQLPDAPKPDVVIDSPAPPDGACTVAEVAKCYTGPPETQGKGPCVVGQKQCLPDGTWTACIGEITPKPETCDGQDNNCDGVYDDGIPTINYPVASCNQQCLQVALDPDCDGLKNAQDQWAACNKLVFSDDFIQPVSATWNQSGNVVSTCGEAVFGETGTLRLAGNPAVIGPSYIVEARVTLGKEVSAPSWSIGVSSADDGASQRRTCEIWVSKVNNVMKPSIHMFMGNSSASSGAWDPGFSFDAGEGESFILQSFGTATTHTCRLISGDTAKELYHLTSPPMSFSFSVSGSATASTNGRSAAFDYVRVFELP